MQKRPMKHLTIFPNNFGITNEITQQRIYSVTKIMNRAESYNVQYYKNTIIRKMT